MKTKDAEAEPEKPKTPRSVFWCSESLKEELVNTWPLEMKRRVGFQLRKVQDGLDPDDWKPMNTIGTGVKEIRLQDADRSQYRLIYIAKYEEAIYVLHVITKKTTQKTDPNDIQQARTRLKEVERARRKK